MKKEKEECEHDYYIAEKRMIWPNTTNKIIPIPIETTIICRRCGDVIIKII